ncbi:terpene synthase [Thozetella sp. PMI_491]|nr:terpene synthase [Thozetella sp. PMI_491]
MDGIESQRSLTDPRKIGSYDSVLQEKTDYGRWRLKDDDSRHTWHYLSAEDATKERPQTYAEKYFLGLPMNLPSFPKAVTPLAAAYNGLAFYEKLQLPSGHWGCHFAGPMIFTPGLVISWYVTETPVPAQIATELRRYLVKQAHLVDGGWGLHTTGESTVCATVLNYCALRLLGVSPEDPVLAKARDFIHQHGGAVQSSIWAKFWLAVLGVLDWDIVNPIPPEIWLLPDWMPVAPWRLFAYIRHPLQPMSYLYSKRLSYKGKLVQALRGEVLTQHSNQPSAGGYWKRHRNTVAEIDRKNSRSAVLDCVNWLFVNIWNPYLRTNSVKQMAESRVSQLIDMEDKNTDYLGVAAVEAPISTIVCYYRDGADSISFKKHIQRLQEYLWMTPDGMSVTPTNGSQCWDTAFLIQTVYHCGFEQDKRWRDMLFKAYSFLERQQIQEDAISSEMCYRQPRKGGWAFSNKYQGYVVSDCVAEALKAVILLSKKAQFPDIFGDRRIFDAVDLMLLYQNAGGGVSAFEAKSGGGFLELFNLSEIFRNVMVEHDYTECTSSCVTALCLFREYWPEYRKDDIQNFITAGNSWIKKSQRVDGSWYGNWGICFTYGTMFALESLASVGERYDTSESCKRACGFLISKQREDGGWSESFKAYEAEEYQEDPSGSLVVQTAWALIGLMAAQYPELEPLKRGIAFLASRQQGNGEWFHEGSPGTFFGHNALTYPNYKFYFTIKALGIFGRRYSDFQLCHESG